MEPSLPQRAQRKRTKGWRAPANAIYIGRPTRRALSQSPFANPYTIAEHGREGALTKFRAYLARLPAWDLDSRLTALEHYAVLLCWCPLDQPCHGDVWVELLQARRKTILLRKEA